jgi:prepilin-type N-terminal cleavage/methylation domain-containing protein
MRAWRDCRGLSLFEMLVAVSIGSVLFVLCGQLFATSQRVLALNALAVQRVAAMVDTGDQFAAAVRDSAAVVARAGDHESGPRKLVLRMDSPDGAPRYCVLAEGERPGHWYRLDFELRDGGHAATRWVRFPLPLAEGRFEYDAGRPADARRVTFHYQLAREQGEREAPMPTHTRVATPRTRLPEATR